MINDILKEIRDNLDAAASELRAIDQGNEADEYIDGALEYIDEAISIIRGNKQKEELL